MKVGVLDLLLEEFPNRALEFGGDLLWLIADIELRHLTPLLCILTG